TDAGRGEACQPARCRSRSRPSRLLQGLRFSWENVRYIERQACGGRSHKAGSATMDGGRSRPQAIERRVRIDLARNVVERIGPLEAALGMAALEVADLIADIGDDPVAVVPALLDQRPRRGLVDRYGLVRRVAGAHENRLPAVIARLAEVVFGR